MNRIALVVLLLAARAASAFPAVDASDAVVVDVALHDLALPEIGASVAGRGAAPTWLVAARLNLDAAAVDVGAGGAGSLVRGAVFSLPWQVSAGPWLSVLDGAAIGLQARAALAPTWRIGDAVVWTGPTVRALATAPEGVGAVQTTWQVGGGYMPQGSWGFFVDVEGGYAVGGAGGGGARAACALGARIPFGAAPAKAEENQAPQPIDKDAT